jgi:hypothetical protein
MVSNIQNKTYKLGFITHASPSGGKFSVYLIVTDLHGTGTGDAIWVYTNRTFTSKDEALEWCAVINIAGNVDLNSFWKPIAGGKLQKTWLWLWEDKMTMVYGNQIPMEFVNENAETIVRTVNVDNSPSPYDDGEPTVECKRCGEIWYESGIGNAINYDLNWCDKCWRAEADDDSRAVAAAL